MDQLNGLGVPQSLSEVCRPERLGLIVYDMQVGILEQIADKDKAIENVTEVLEAARAAKVPNRASRARASPARAKALRVPSRGSPARAASRDNRGSNRASVNRVNPAGVRMNKTVFQPYR